MNEVRIIGGMWRRRKIAFPSRPGLRPTPDRTRETLFNWLAGYVEGRRCLDLFAGSGALGFEAASRGAAEVVLVERDPAAVRALLATVAKLGATVCTVARGSALDWLERAAAEPFDIVFLDPPFADDASGEVLRRLLESRLVHAESFVYIEFRRGAMPGLDGFAVVKSTRAGDSEARLLRPVHPDPSLPVTSRPRPRGGS
jgi:16S rRNA (guanine966-N2)-methyltransferase